MPCAEWHRAHLGNILVQDVVTISASPKICTELGLGVPTHCTVIVCQEKRVTSACCSLLPHGTQALHAFPCARLLQEQGKKESGMYHACLLFDSSLIMGYTSTDV